MKRLILAAIALALMGCVYKGAKITEGTDLAVGLAVPGTEGAIQFDALNYLTGFRLGVAENAQLEVKYKCAETNDYFWGAITTRSCKSVDACVKPCADEAEDEGGATDREGETPSEEPPGP